MSDVEGLLYRAFSPIEPPAGMYDRLGAALERASQAAADEIADWELRAMRDPRNWVRPATALVIGGAAATGLVLMRARGRNTGHSKAAHRFGDELAKQLRKNTARK